MYDAKENRKMTGEIAYKSIDEILDYLKVSVEECKDPLRRLKSIAMIKEIKERFDRLWGKKKE